MLKLILLPGMDGTGKLFGPLVEQLRTRFAVKVLSYPTDQILSYPELQNLIQPIMPASEPFVLMAESFSTPLAVMFAAQRPSNLKALILCVGFVRSPVRGWRRLICSRLAPSFLGGRLPDAAIRFLLAGSDAAPTLLTEIRSVISLVKPGVLTCRLRAVLACDARADISKVEVPILYLQATHDRLVGPSCLEEIRRANPRVVVEEIEGPHLLLRLEPERAVTAIRAFMEQIPVN